MGYSFACPHPCNCEIRVHASSSDDAVNKMIAAGAMSCRNSDTRCRFEKADPALPPIAEDQLRRIIQLCMQEEHEVR